MIRPGTGSVSGLAGRAGMLARLVESSRMSVRDGVYDAVPPGRPCQSARKWGRGAVARAIRRVASTGLAPVISEVKFSSPSMGRIREKESPAAIATSMATAGACAVSVLTQPRMFGGSPNALAVVRDALPNVPILMKDVVIDRRQIDAAHDLGADCVLLMQSLFDGGLVQGMDDLVSHAHSLGMEVIAEAHTPLEFAHAAATDADLLGINNRNLDTLGVDLGTTEAVLSEAGRSAGRGRGPGLGRGRARPSDARPVVSESGITTPADVARLHAAGADAFLVGTAIMSSGGRVGAAVARLVAAV